MNDKQWRPCDKAFALAHHQQSQACYTEAPLDPGPWVSPHQLAYDREGIGVYEFRTIAPEEVTLCTIPAGTESVEVHLATEDGDETSTATIALSGRKGRIVFVEDSDA